MRRTAVLLCIFSILLFAAAGCAAPLREMKGITRVGYSIQVGAFAEVSNAERLAAKLQTRGVDSFYFKRETGVYAVRFGDYPSAEAARKAAQKLVAEKVIGSFFIASPQGISQEKTPAEVKGAPPPVRKPAGNMGTIAARTAERFVGIPYQWGGNNVVEGMDCSGFVRAVYNLCGVNIPRTSREQFRTGDPIARGDLMDGDLVFFGASSDDINHVGIYVGSGRFVHAPRRGDDIRISSMDEGYFSRKFIGAKRYF